MANKTGPEIHPAVDAANVQAKRNAEAFSEATKRAVADATAFSEVVKHRRKKRATLALIARVVAAILLGIGITVLRIYEQLTPEVAIFSISALFCWLSIWVGAWCQYMWGKGGLLR
jgi:hypothetical protein